MFNMFLKIHSTYASNMFNSQTYQYITAYNYHFIICTLGLCNHSNQCKHPQYTQYNNADMSLKTWSLKMIKQIKL